MSTPWQYPATVSGRPKLARSALRSVAQCGVALACAGLALSASASFLQTNLVSDVANIAAFTDPNLRNPWGMASSATSPVWIADNATGLSTLYNTAGTPQALVVSTGATPTGVAFNPLAASGQFGGDLFLFVGLDGSIHGWRGALGTTAEVLQLGGAGDVYTGATIGTVGSNAYLYAANFSTGAIDVLKGNAAAPAIVGRFTDPNLPAGYAPFDIQNLGGTLFVSYAQVDPGPGLELDGAGHGFIDRYDLGGNFLGRLVSQGALDSPWGMTIAPAGFGSFGGALLVANHGAGTIEAYNTTSGAFLGTVSDAQDAPIVIDGLWGLRFGNAGSGGNADTLYFTAGPGAGAHGLYGSITARPGSTVPEPGSLGLLLAAGLALAAFTRAAPRASARTRAPQTP